MLPRQIEYLEPHYIQNFAKRCIADWYAHRRRLASAIKGNIRQSGERIYHVPGGNFYDRTVISLTKGEHWFCSEAEAQAAGWRRSRR
jgi:hypothetical protein